jgi:hypothetical protein
MKLTKIRIRNTKFSIIFAWKVFNFKRIKKKKKSYNYQQIKRPLLFYSKIYITTR